jgi:hypothetical protein
MRENLVVTVHECDPETNSEIAGHVLANVNWAELADLLGIEEDEAEVATRPVTYDLDVADMALMAERFGLQYQSAECSGRLSDWKDVPGRPYALHTNRELWMMLRGEKPFAAFLDQEGFTETIGLGGQPFQTYVEQGRLIRHDRRFERSGVRLHRLLFALPGEEWRFKAFELMWDLAEFGPWNDTLERMEGRLLGYEDWQTDWHLAHRRELDAPDAKAEKA